MWPILNNSRGAVKLNHLNTDSFQSGVDANGYKVEIKPNGKRVWFKKGTITADNGWNAMTWRWVVLDSKLPVGVNNLGTYNVTSSVICNDTAISTSGVNPTGNSIAVATANYASFSINAQVFQWSVRIEEV